MLKVREQGRVVNVHPEIATGVNAEALTSLSRTPEGGTFVTLDDLTPDSLYETFGSNVRGTVFTVQKRCRFSIAELLSS